jgi:3-oxoacyl-[acyl-carrier-protein] synthase II
VAVPVITGLGCVTPIGIGRDAFAAALRAGKSGTSNVSSFDPDQFRCRVAAEVMEFRPQDFMAVREVRSSPRVVQFAVAACRLAQEDAGIRNWSDPARVGVYIGSSVGPSTYNFEQFATFLERGARRVPPSFPAQAHYGAIPSECAIQLNVRGPVLAVSSACTSGADAIGLAGALIRSGIADVMLVGGAEAPICPMLFAAFDRLNLMASKFNGSPQAACRPFSRDRDGFVLGEGAAMFVVESLEHARGRGVRPIATLSGYAATCDAYSHFSHDSGGADAVRAILSALHAAGVGADEVDYINAHGSATIENDVFETRVLRAAFGDRAYRVPVSSSKSMFGHLLGASAAVELAATVVAMDEGFVPPTINLGSQDEQCDLDYVAGQSREGAMQVGLSISFGFGSRNAALVVRRSDD